MSDKKIQWHSGFVAAMYMELAAYRDALLFEKEYNLNTRPLEIDLLIIKKAAGIQIENEIGKFFRHYNLMEYKSPADELNIDTFYKSIAYAALYKSYGETVNSRKTSEITISIIREAKPHKLFAYFAKQDITLSNPAKGIYYMPNRFLFPVQIIVAKELDKADHIWLSSLSPKMKKQDMIKLFQRIDALKSAFDKELADSVLEISVRANEQIVNELRGDDLMCQALLEIMEPEINKIKKSLEESITQSVTESVTKSVTESVTKSVTQSVTQSVTESVTEDVTRSVTESVTKSVTESKIVSAVRSFRDFGISTVQIKEALIKHFQLSPAEADSYLYTA